MFKTTSLTLPSDVAPGGTFTVGYPTGTTKGSYNAGVVHRMVALQTSYVAPKDFTVSFGSTNITVTYNGATTLPAGTFARLQFDMAGDDANLTGINDVTSRNVVLPDGVSKPDILLVELGSPIAGSSTSISASQAVSSGVAAVINGATLLNGEAVFDVPRNVVAAWTNTAVVTVVGTDVYGNTIVEQSASGTSLTGKKAFKSITSITPNASVTGFTAGTGNVLGLPVYVENATYLLKEAEDDAAAVAGTLVAGLAPGTKSTATTADVRGTYVPNSTPDGSKSFALTVIANKPFFLGNPQYAG